MSRRQRNKERNLGIRKQGQQSKKEYKAQVAEGLVNEFGDTVEEEQVGPLAN
jgi:hypothetical protein